MLAIGSLVVVYYTRSGQYFLFVLARIYRALLPSLKGHNSTNVTTIIRGHAVFGPEPLQVLSTPVEAQPRVVQVMVFSQEELNICCLFSDSSRGYSCVHESTQLLCTPVSCIRDLQVLLYYGRGTQLTSDRATRVSYRIDVFCTTRPLTASTP